MRLYGIQVLTTKKGNLRKRVKLASYSWWYNKFLLRGIGSLQTRRPTHKLIRQAEKDTGCPCALVEFVLTKAKEKVG